MEGYVVHVRKENAICDIHLRQSNADFLKWYQYWLDIVKDISKEFMVLQGVEGKMLLQKRRSAVQGKLFFFYLVPPCRPSPLHIRGKHLGYYIKCTLLIRIPF